MTAITAAEAETRHVARAADTSKTPVAAEVGGPLPPKGPARAIRAGNFQNLRLVPQMEVGNDSQRAACVMGIPGGFLRHYAPPGARTVLGRPVRRPPTG